MWILSTGHRFVGAPQVVVGVVRSAFSGEVRTPDGRDILPTNLKLDVTIQRSPQQVASLRFSEHFPGAFKISSGAVAWSRNELLQETGPFTWTAIYDEVKIIAGWADPGTAVTVTFTNIPSGIHVFVTRYPSAASSGVLARLIDHKRSGPEAAPLAPCEVPLVSGYGRAAWEIVRRDATNPIFLDFALFVSADDELPIRMPSQATISLSLAPIHGPTTASATAPIPRFVDLGTGRNFFRTG
jgi:hypothetical protein